MKQQPFTQLLEESQQQTDAQRLLFLFVETQLEGKHSGTITPTMCVDKLPSDLTSFNELVNEADSISKNWDFMLIAAMTGQGNQAPSEEDAEPYLNKMTHDVSHGGDVSRYLVLNRQQEIVELAAK